ncbi:RNA polymerase II subunit A C-terminal domain phosphatase [Sphaceloma murrayae]|uniref:RNA polymerase II subunit A C-terminal domain phosphatase n=1 Tax=Sphaceloma murrayae TaxID=2082308 RepID=A0A2K1QHA5_9PEZI|nr:RNA polymerase II subunit A C-terminal domain phosphatase [Sphaceloma murrayae]
MRLITPHSLHYPITVTRLRAHQDEDISQGDPLFDYRYETTVIEGTEDNPEGEPVKRTLYSTYETDLEGTLGKFLIRPGSVISRGGTPIGDVEEACRHEVQFQGMCADCGKDMTEVTYNTVQKNTARATIKAAHSHIGLRVSQAEANKADEEAKKRLISSRKLSLVVDLDQTIIQATVDSTVGEWQNDPTNPNHDAVKHVQAFQLNDENPVAKGTWYYIKLRPGLREFLDEVVKMYELHVYTMGTRKYAEEIMKIVDPERRLFGDRILSRNESGSMTSKDLRRLFPVDTKMVVIIDDRGDVWHWSQNLIKVTAYDFFVGIGDINSSFLPKRPGIDDVPPPPQLEAPTNGSDQGNTNGTLAKSKPTRPPSTDTPESPANGDVSTIDQLISMGASTDANKLQEQTHEHDETIAAQQADRPLLQKQKILDAAEEEASSLPADSPQQNGSHPPPPSRHNLLRDDDNELHFLRQSLTTIHTKFWTEFDTLNTPSAPPPSRVSQLSHAPRVRAPSDTASPSIPDVTTIMAQIKSSILRGVHIVFSGVLPLGTPTQSHDLAVWARSFGAGVEENITKRTTHVIASPARRTAKVRQAWRRSDRIRIVTQRWLIDCLAQWRKVETGPYRIHLDIEADVATNASERFEEAAGSGSESEAAVTEEEETDGIGGKGEEGDDEGDGGKGAVDAEGDGTDTETETELKKHMPSLSREDSSLHEETKEDWDDIDGELAEFLGSDADDSGSDAESSGRASDAEGKGKKRKREGREGEEGDSEGESRLQVRKKKALERTSSLTHVEVAEGGVASREKTIDEEGEQDEEQVVQEEEDGEEEEEEEEEEEGDLEKELMAEMMKDDDDEEDGDDDGSEEGDAHADERDKKLT